ncbi:MAG: hypothetical protein NTAFB05_05750 [Nitrobacter sp.]
MAGDLAEHDRRLAELQRNLNASKFKLADAQKAQAEVMRKTRELDDAKRELDLKAEEKVQASLAKVRNNAKAEAEDRLAGIGDPLRDRGAFGQCCGGEGVASLEIAIKCLEAPSSVAPPVRPAPRRVAG